MVEDVENVAVVKTKCAFIKKYGGISNVQVGLMDVEPLENKVEVELKIAGMNFADNYMREGLGSLALPLILGIEAAGIVTAIGADVNTDLKVGQRVICYKTSGGLYSKLIRIDPKYCFKLPDYISFECGAALFVNYLTAYFSLYEIGNLKPHESVLIKSCAGGVGCALTQLAKLVENVKIFGTTSKGKEQFALQNGVDFVWTPEKLIKNHEESFDVIIENESGPSFNAMCQKLKPLGRIISIGANDLIGNNQRLSYLKMLKFFLWDVKSINRNEMMMNSQRIAGLHLGNLCEQVPKKIQDALNEIFELLRMKKIEPKVDSVWKLEDIKEAIQIMVDRKNMGKILITID